jgi:hypothetical protein
VAHVLDTGADGRVVHAGRDQRRREVHGLLCRAALAVHGRGRRLDREARLEPGVPAHVEHLLAVLLHAARDDVLDLRRVDSGALDDLGIGLGEQRVGVRVLVITLLGMAASDRRPHGLDNHHFASVPVSHVVSVLN